MQKSTWKLSLRKGLRLETRRHVSSIKVLWAVLPMGKQLSGESPRKAANRLHCWGSCHKPTQYDEIYHEPKQIRLLAG